MRFSGILFAVLVVSTASVSLQPAMAAPLAVDRSLASSAATPQPVRYRHHGWRHHGWHHHGRHHYGWRRGYYGPGAVVGGLAAGAIIGSAIAGSEARAANNDTTPIAPAVSNPMTRAPGLTLAMMASGTPAPDPKTRIIPRDDPAACAAGFLCSEPPAGAGRAADPADRGSGRLTRLHDLRHWCLARRVRAVDNRDSGNHPGLSPQRT
jgi:hypothetical protein